MNTLRTLTATAAAGATVLALASPASALYAGNIQATLLGTMSTSLGAGCSTSTLSGSLASGGGLTISGATFGSCSGATVTAQNLSWTGSITAPGTPPADGKVTINGFKIKAVAIIGTCYYGGNLSATAFNGTNPNRPVTSNNQFQIYLNNASASKQSGSSFLCPGSASVTAAYQVLGESSPGSGTYNQTISLP
ncbi:hypothetical protein ABGB12_11885 [Actinocorallia sp. B10E7]|uniref:hypothetical protein n=1 Tax=Actinocorallia sp. B10E7 TaxID=3153558 RepID=UPI00325DED1F